MLPPPEEGRKVGRLQAPGARPSRPSHGNPCAQQNQRQEDLSEVAFPQGAAPPPAPRLGQGKAGKREQEQSAPMGLSRCWVLGTGAVHPCPADGFPQPVGVLAWGSAGDRHFPWGHSPALGTATMGAGHRPAGGCSFCRMVETASFFSCVVALRYSWSSSLSKTLSSGRSWSSTAGNRKKPISQRAGLETRQKGLERVEDPRMGIFPSQPGTAQAVFAKCTRTPSMHKLFHLHADTRMQPAEPMNGNTSSAGYWAAIKGLSTQIFPRS